MLKVEIDYTITESKRANSARATLLTQDISGEYTFQQYARDFQLFQVAVAQDALTEEQQQGFDKTPRVITDNKLDKPYQDVKLAGKIEFVARQDVLEAVIECYKLIQQYSKRVSGQYAKWNAAFVNGVMVASSLPSLQRWAKTAQLKGGDKVRLINLNAYARRLEYLGGSEGGGRRIVKNMRTRNKKRVQDARRPMKNAPNGPYYLSHRIITKKYQSMGKKKFTGISFEFMRGNRIGGIPVNGQRGTYIKKAHNKWSGREYLYPAIVFNIDARGIL